MSELNELNELNEQSIDDLNEDIEIEVEDDSYVPTPVDPTLSIEGEAADAKATGDAIAEVLNGFQVNGQSVDANKHVTVYADQISMSSEAGAQTVAQAIENAGDKNASEILYETIGQTNRTVKQVVDEIRTGLDTDMTEAEMDDMMDEIFGGEE